jgi:hypothetical protein
MGDLIRILGLASAAFCLGALVVFAYAPKGTTAFAPPARYWAIAAGVLIEVSGIIARFSLWGDPFNVRDITFLIITVLMIIAVTMSLTHGPPERKV